MGAFYVRTYFPYILVILVVDLYEAVDGSSVQYAGCESVLTHGSR